jgi:hypothetical protein
MFELRREEFKLIPRTKRITRLWVCHGKKGDGIFSCSNSSSQPVIVCAKCGGVMKPA